MNVLLILVMAAIAVVMLLGLVSLWKGGDFSRKHSNRLMRWRVMLQALAIALVGIALFLSGRG
ncbi:MAG: twin transmembrane helix small protein [Alphaproteobacteria bacterium]